MRSIRINRLVQREVGRGVVECLVQSRHSSWEALRESCDVFLEVTFALSGCYWASWTVVVVENDVVVVLICIILVLLPGKCFLGLQPSLTIFEILLAKKITEGAVAKSHSLVRA